MTKRMRVLRKIYPIQHSHHLFMAHKPNGQEKQLLRKKSRVAVATAKTCQVVQITRMESIERQEENHLR